MAPTRTTFAKGRLCTAGPFDRRGAMRHETPVLPPRGGEAALGAARQEA
jgi:hypothetical protein